MATATSSLLLEKPSMGLSSILSPPESARMQDGASASGPSRSLRYHLYTLWLFTRSDLKTIVLPCSTFALGLALSPAEVTRNRGGLEMTSFTSLAIRVPLMVMWIWNLVLVSAISNQRAPDASLEDEVNKPWRPMPSKRLSGAEAQEWLKGSIISATVLGLIFGNFASTATMAILTWLYNDIGGHAVIWQRNLICSVGYTICGYGALVVLCGAELLPKAVDWALMAGGIVLTTVHMQDLPDVEGDAARGRETVPIVWGDLNARISLAAWIPFWSAACPFFWGANLTGWAVSLGFGVVLAVMTMQRRGQDWDKMCWKLCCFWVTMLYMLPTFGV